MSGWRQWIVDINLYHVIVLFSSPLVTSENQKLIVNQWLVAFSLLWINAYYDLSMVSKKSLNRSYYFLRCAVTFGYNLLMEKLHGTFD